MFYVRANFSCVKGHLMFYVNCHHLILPQELSLFHSKFQGKTAGTSFQLFSEEKPNFNFLDKHFSLSPNIFATYSPKFLMTFLVIYHKQGRLEGAQVDRLLRGPVL